MKPIKKAIFCWSGGKDSAFALFNVLNEKIYDVCYLLTTVNDSYKRISMHGVREELLDMQADSIGIPVLKVRIKEGTYEEYDTLMQETFAKAKSEGITHVIFGDIFLEDLRSYREGNLKKLELIGVFPLWKFDTQLLIQEFVQAKFKTITCCISNAFLNEDWVGKELDLDFIKELPILVDPCGENGEYHTFCYDGPIFKKKVPFELGEKMFKPLNQDSFTNELTTLAVSGFWYCDLIPK